MHQLCCSVNPYIFCVRGEHMVCIDHVTINASVAYRVDGIAVTVCTTCREQINESLLQSQSNKGMQGV